MESAMLSSAATHVAAVERDVSREAITAEDHRRTRLSLPQTRVSKRVETGTVACDADRDRVRLVAEAELLAPFRTDRHPETLATRESAR